MNTAAVFRVLLVCVIAAADAVAGTAPMPRNPLNSKSENDYWMEWWNSMHLAQVRLERMPAGSRGYAVNETLQTLSDNSSGLGIFGAGLHRGPPMGSQDIPETLMSDSLAAALSGVGMGKGRSVRAGDGFLPEVLYRMYTHPVLAEPPPN